MQQTFLLYIDILGFGDLCEAMDDKVKQIYDEVLAMRTRGQQTYSVTIFSDTILVRNLGILDPLSEIQFLIEFFRLLQDRLARLAVFLRSIITLGYFHEERSDDVYLAYGPAVVSAYKAEKRIQSVGLFLYPSCAEYNKFYPQILVPEHGLYFIFTLESLERLDDTVYVSSEILTETDQFTGLPGDISFLSQIHACASSLPCDSARNKHKAYLAYYTQRHPNLFKALLADNFSLAVINEEHDWQQ